VVDPWGKVLVDLGEEVGCEVVELDLDQSAQVRAKVPVKA